MDKVKVLIETAIETYQIGQKLYDNQQNSVRKTVAVEAARILSVLILSALWIIGFIATVVMVLMSVSNYLVDLIQPEWMKLIVPIIIPLVLVFIIFIRKNTIKRRLAKMIVREMIS